MNILSYFRKGAQPGTSTSAPIHVPYMELQHFFQIFANGFIETPEMDHRSVTVPGTILRAQKLPEAEIFFDEDLGKVEISSEHINEQGDHLYIGHLVTHGQTMAFQYLYIVLAKGKPANEKGLAHLDPHFVFLGAIIPGELNQPDMVEMLYLMTKSEWDGKKSTYLLNDIRNPDAIITALVYGDQLVRALYAGIPIDNDMLAADVANMDPITRFLKFCWHAEHRNAATFDAELAELRADYATNGFTIPALKLERT